MTENATILVVDDSTENLRVLVAMLKGPFKGYMFLQKAVSGAEDPAKESVDNDRPHVCP